jgi:cell pole-organizing protein PopZ
MSGPEKPGDPSMDEILASIRQVISDEPGSGPGAHNFSSVNPLLSGSEAGVAGAVGESPPPPPSVDRLSGALRARVPAALASGAIDTSFDDDLADLLDKSTDEEAQSSGSSAKSAPEVSELRLPEFPPFGGVRASSADGAFKSLYDDEAAPDSAFTSEPVSVGSGENGSLRRTASDGARPPSRMGALHGTSFYPPKGFAPKGETPFSETSSPLSLDVARESVGVPAGGGTDAMPRGPQEPLNGASSFGVASALVAGDENQFGTTTDAPVLRPESFSHLDEVFDVTVESAPEAAYENLVLRDDPRPGGEPYRNGSVSGSGTANGNAAFDALAQTLAATGSGSPAMPLHPLDAPVLAALIAHPAERQEGGVLGRTLEDAVSDMLKPLLQQWLAENMPRIIERALSIEAASVGKPPQKP